MLYLGQPMLFECSLEFVFALKGALAKLPRNSFWTRTSCQGVLSASPALILFHLPFLEGFWQLLLFEVGLAFAPVCFCWWLLLRTCAHLHSDDAVHAFLVLFLWNSQTFAQRCKFFAYIFGHFWQFFWFLPTMH